MTERVLEQQCISTSVARIACSAEDERLIPDVQLGILTQSHGWWYFELPSENVRDLITALEFALSRPDIASLELQTSGIVDERESFA